MPTTPIVVSSIWLDQNTSPRRFESFFGNKRQAQNEKIYRYDIDYKITLRSPLAASLYDDQSGLSSVHYDIPSAVLTGYSAEKELPTTSSSSKKKGKSEKNNASFVTSLVLDYSINKDGMPQFVQQNVPEDEFVTVWLVTDNELEKDVVSVAVKNENEKSTLWPVTDNEVKKESAPVQLVEYKKIILLDKGLIFTTQESAKLFSQAYQTTQAYYNSDYFKKGKTYLLLTEWTLNVFKNEVRTTALKGYKFNYIQDYVNAKLKDDNNFLLGPDHSPWVALEFPGKYPMSTIKYELRNTLMLSRALVEKARSGLQFDSMLLRPEDVDAIFKPEIKLNNHKIEDFIMEDIDYNLIETVQIRFPEEWSKAKMIACYPNSYASHEALINTPLEKKTTGLAKNLLSKLSFYRKKENRESDENAMKSKP